jgi:hypothetical protein
MSEKNSTWRLPADAPPSISRCLAVEDMLALCQWHFACREDGEWFDLSSGAPFEPTHWMPLPPTPTGAHP